MLNLFFRNRRLLLLAIALIVVTGLSSILVLPRLEDPVLKQRASIIHTPFPGANAVRVESLVSEVIEDALKEIEEIRVIRSASRNELSTITMELHDHVYDVDDVWSRVRDKLNDVSAELPAGAGTPRFVDLKFSAYASLYALKWTSESPVNRALLQRHAEIFEQRLRAIPGTDDVDLFGNNEEEIVIELDQQQIASMGLTPQHIAGIVQASDAKISAGGLRSSHSDIVVEVDSEFETLERIARTPIQASPDGRMVLLRDVAEISKALQDPPSTLSFVGGEPSIVLGCFIQPDTRIDLWTTDAADVVSQMSSELPDGIDLEVVFLQDRYVTKRLARLLMNLGLGACAVTFVIFIMMGWRSAIVVGTSLPLSGLMVLGGLRLLGIPLHQMSVTGLIIALGLLIDNAIVIVDEFRKQMLAGKTRSQAIVDCVRHLAVPLAGSTFTTCLAFAPLALMPGPAGEFVGAIGISVILAVTSSLFLSLTVIPALIALTEREVTDRPTRRWWNSGAGTEPMYREYGRGLSFLFSKPALGIAIGVAVPFVGFWLARGLPEQFFPPSDRDQFEISLRLQPESSIEQTVDATEVAREIALEYPNIDRVEWFVGESAPAFYYNMLPLRSGVPYYAQAMVQANERESVTETIHQLQADIEQALPHVQVNVSQLEQGPPVDAPIMIRILGPELDEIKRIGKDVRRRMAALPNVVSTTSDVESATAKLSLTVDEEQAQLAGLSHSDIAIQLGAALDGASGGSLLDGTEVIPVRIKLADQQRSSVSVLDSFDLVAPGENGNQSIPVEAIGNWKLVPNDSTIERINGYRMNEIQVQVKAGILASTVLEAFKTDLEANPIEMPPGYQISYAGESAERNRAVNNLLGSAGVLAVLMIAGLVLSFQSFRLAAVIGVVGGLSVGLGLFALSTFGYPFGFTAIVGIMGLVGVAINDSIVVLAAIRADEEARLGDRQAIKEVVFRATRHVLSTTFTTIAGFIPLILGGGGFWPPLAIAIAGGVSGATLLALFFVPSVYIFVMKKRSFAESSEVDTIEFSRAVETSTA